MFFDEMEKDEVDAFLESAFADKDSGDLTPEDARDIREKHFRKLKEDRDAEEQTQRDNYRGNFSKIKEAVELAEEEAREELTNFDLHKLQTRRGKVAKAIELADDTDIRINDLIKYANELDKEIELKLSAGFHAYRDAGPEVSATEAEYDLDLDTSSERTPPKELSHEITNDFISDMQFQSKGWID